MSDLIEECRKAAKTLDGFNRIPIVPDLARTDPALIEILSKSALEMEKLRKEVKLLKARNASLVWRLVWVMLIFAGVVCGTFMAVFLSQ